ncbi:MAG TPA: 1-deoxy-D-xylulose-5-phosphate synthase [Armatimonadota bacterium]|nr:1-deoxy-D-xylulose-5-phosphate synthase [Armatimonadota bacterium]
MSRLLDTIDSPRDLKRLSAADLPRLAQEIRSALIETVSMVGGHLAPNLGVVELTIALHRAFDAPRDRIVFDVGHQAYVHKLLTGRREQFGTLRRRGGISGFPRRCESPYDVFGTGHGSTSISAALGIATARDLAGEHYQVVAVIGDGAMTGGMAFEGLNQVAERDTDLVIILNDNGMSISPNVGAMARYLQRFRLDPGYSSAKRSVEGLVRRYDRFGLGNHVLDAVEKLKDGAKSLFLPGMLFEELGLRYFGPVDGHDLDELTRTFEQVRRLKGPRIVHVVTQKGRGYRLAEEDAESYHGCKPFDVDQGQLDPPVPQKTYSEVFSEALAGLAEADSRIVAVTAAMCVGTGLKPFARRFPHRFFDVGMAEEHAVTFAAGLAAEGWRPVVAIYSTFLQRAYDQVLHDVCLQGLPVVFCLDRAGLVGSDGPTHHGVFDFSYLRHIPGLVVGAPRSGAELKRMLAAAFAHDGPFAIRYPAGAAEETESNGRPSTLEIGRGEVLREGSQATLVAVGSCVGAAQAAADELAGDGMQVGVIDARFVKPLDTGLLEDAGRLTGLLVTVEENVLQGGFGAAVLEWAAPLGIRVHRLGIADEFVPHGSQTELRQLVGIDADSIAQAVRHAVAGRVSAGP